MQSHRARPQTSQVRRSGLAPLELVLSLPILLFVMGLMIIVGTAGAWKVRAQGNSREAIWRSLTLRDGNIDPNPRGWPQDAEMEVQGASADMISTDPWQGFPVVRGPVISDPNSGASLPVLQGTLDMTSGTLNGHASITRSYPVMKDMDPGEMTLKRDHQLMDGTRFQYHTMGLGSNLTRRILTMYPLNLQGQAADVTQAFVNVALEIVFHPRKEQLTPLEGRDPEIYELIGAFSPDFQPQLSLGYRSATISALRGRILRPTFAEKDPSLVQSSQQMQNLKRTIRRVPQNMTSYYLGVYQAVKAQLENDPNPPPGAAALIRELDRKIKELERFQATLTPQP